MKIIKQLFGAFLSGGMLIGSLYLLWAYAYLGPEIDFGAFLGTLAVASLILVGGVSIFLYGLKLLITGK